MIKSTAFPHKKTTKKWFLSQSSVMDMCNNVHSVANDRPILSLSKELYSSIPFFMAKIKRGTSATFPISLHSRLFSLKVFIIIHSKNVFVRTHFPQRSPFRSFVVVDLDFHL